MASDVLIGPRIRELRREKELTLSQLADLTGLSVSYVSQIENEKASPSISTLKRIAAALNVRMVEFFADELVEDPPVMTRDKWTHMTIPGWQANLSQLVHIVGNKRMQPFHTHLEPGGGPTEDYSHPGEEFGYVLEGELTLYLGEETHLLKAGDAVYFSSLIPHSWRNLTDSICRLIWVVSPPSW